jgi:hypothetical protein
MRDFLLQDIWKKSFYNEAYLKIDLFRKEKSYFAKKNSKGSKLTIAADQKYISVFDSSILTLTSYGHSRQELSNRCLNSVRSQEYF